MTSDPSDKIVSFRSQREFVERVRATGVPVLHVTARAKDKHSHDLHAHGVRPRVRFTENKGAEWANWTRARMLYEQSP